MIDQGYMAKHIAARTEWLTAPGVKDIYSVSNCLSEDFCDYIDSWRFNGYWFFDSPEIIREVAKSKNVDLAGTTLLYYRGHDQQWDEAAHAWTPCGPSSGMQTRVTPPADASLVGYDVVCYTMNSMHECSPLSCNGIASNLAVNEHCLLDTLGAAISHLERGAFDNSEPGPFRIQEVSLVDWDDHPTSDCSAHPHSPT